MVEDGGGVVIKARRAPFEEAGHQHQFEFADNLA
jgi:hypothetical protein